MSTIEPRKRKTGSRTRGEKSPWLNVEDQERERQLKRNALLRAAAIEFGERGFRSTSLDIVAARLGISKPTIYHYFSCKEEILYEIVKESLITMQRVIDAAEGANGFQRLRALLIAYAKTLTVDYGKCVIRTPKYDLSPEGREQLIGMKKEVDKTIREAIREGIEDGSIRDYDVKMATFVVAGGLNWIAQWHNPDGPLSDDEVANQCVDILLGGFSNRPRRLIFAGLRGVAHVIHRRAAGKRARSGFRRGGDRRRLCGPLPALRAARARPARAGAGGWLGRRRRLALESLSGRAARFGKLHLLLFLFGGIVSRLVVVRALRRAAGTEGLFRPCRRQVRPAQGHPL